MDVQIFLEGQGRASPPSSLSKGGFYNCEGYHPPPLTRDKSLPRNAILPSFIPFTLALARHPEPPPPLRASTLTFTHGERLEIRSLIAAKGGLA